MHRLLALLFVLSLTACASPRLARSEQAQLVGRVYVVTGASSGFGQGVALKLGQQRARVVLAARRAELLEETAGRIRASGGEALVVPTDVGDPAQVERLAAAAMQRFGRVDVWMNIAGVGALGRFWELPVADQARVVDTNFKGVIYGSHAALNLFRRQPGRGVLVNMSSVEGQVPLAYHSTYAATKAGVLSLGRSINEELRHAGLSRRIKVATVMPYAADTPFFGHQANVTGHAHRIILIDDPQKVVDALLWVSLHPREELPVGWKAQGAVTAHRLLPDLTEHVAANIHRDEIAKGSPVPPTSGAVFAPQPDGGGRTVEGGVRERIDREDRARKRRKSQRK